MSAFQDETGNSPKPVITDVACVTKYNVISHGEIP